MDRICLGLQPVDIGFRTGLVIIRDGKAVGSGIVVEHISSLDLLGGHIQKIIAVRGEAVFARSLKHLLRILLENVYAVFQEHIVVHETELGVGNIAVADSQRRGHALVEVAEGDNGPDENNDGNNTHGDQEKSWLPVDLSAFFRQNGIRRSRRGFRKQRGIRIVVVDDGVDLMCTQFHRRRFFRFPVLFSREIEDRAFREIRVLLDQIVRRHVRIVAFHALAISRVLFGSLRLRVVSGLFQIRFYIAARIRREDPLFRYIFVVAFVFFHITKTFSKHDNYSISTLT